MESLIAYLDDHLSSIPQQGTKYLSKLRSSNGKPTESVYTILHHTTVSLDSISANDQFLDTVKVCIECLKYLVGESPNLGSVPDGGLEKLAYHLIKKTESRQIVEETRVISDNLLSLSSNQKCNNQVLYYVALKLNSLKTQNVKCGCHKGQCDHLKIISCKVNGVVLSALSGNESSFSQFFCTLMNWCVPHISEHHCVCHLMHVAQLLCTVGEQLEYYCDKTSRKVQIKDINCATKVLSTFLCLFAVLGRDSSTCFVQDVKTVLVLYQQLYDSFLALSGVLVDHSQADQEMICKVSCKVYNEIIKHLSHTKHTQASVLQWNKVASILCKMCCLDAFKQNQVVDADVTMKTVFCLNQLVLHQNDNDMKKHSIDCMLNVLDAIEESFSKFCSTTTDFILDCIHNMCIFVVKSKCKRLMEKVVSLSVKSLQLSFTLKSCKKIVRITPLLCSIHRHVNRPQDGMKFAAQSVFHIAPKPETKELVDAWLRCKISWVAEPNSPNSVNSETIADYLPPEMSTPSVLCSLFHELAISKSFRQQPPTEEFHVLRKIIELSKTQTKELTTAQCLMSFLLHSWSSVLKYHSTPLTLSTTTLSLLDNVKINWELVLLARFTQFLCIWEADLSKVWKSRQQCSFVNNGPFSSLKWDAAIPPFSCNKLLEIVEGCHVAYENNYLEMKYQVETIQSLRVIAVILQLRGHIFDALKTYKLVEDLLKEKISTEKADNDPLLFVHLVTTQCRMVQILLQFGLSSLALKVSKEIHQLTEKFGKCVSQSNERPEKIQKLKNQITMDAQCAMLQVTITLQQVPLATKLMNQISNSEFIDADHRRVSHASTVASARVQLLMSDMTIVTAARETGDFNSKHLLSEAVQGTQTIAMMLQMFESNDNSAPPRFGRKTKESTNDMVRQFELLLVLIDGLHRVAELWMLVGSLKFAFCKIVEGIMLTRHYLLPERELQFQLLMTKCVQMERDHTRVQEEISICKDILEYVDHFTTSKKRRHKLFSTSATNEDLENEELEAALNNSSIMELHDKNPDSDEDSVPVSTLPVDMKTTIFTKEYNIMSSPALSKKRKPTKADSKSIFQHDSKCECSSCRNFLLVKQRCQLTLSSASHLETTSTTAESIRVLENAASYIPEKGQLIVSEVMKVFGELEPKDKECTALFTEYLNVTVGLAKVYYNIGDFKSATFFVRNALQKMTANPVDIRKTTTVAEVNLTAGKLLLKAVQPNLTGVSMDSNKVIDALAKFNLNKETEVSITIGSKMEKLTLIDHKVPDLKPPLEKVQAPTPKIAPEVVDLTQFNTPVKLPSKQRRIKSTLSTSEYKTPQVKSRPRQATRTSVKKPAPSKTTTNKKFEIFNDSAVPDVTLSTKSSKTVKKTRGKLPVPNISDSDGDDEWVPESKSTSKTKRTRRVIFSLSSDEADDNTPSIKIPESTPSITTRRTRSKTSATKNVMKARKSARARHRATEGPVYTDEEQETDRPTRKPVKTRKARLGAMVDDETSSTPGNQDLISDEIERVRESTVRDISPLRNSLACMRIADSHASSGSLEFELSTCEEHLSQALEKGIASGDFYLCKQAAQFLALHHSRSCDRSRDIFRMTACHALSIGVTLRWVFNMNLKLRQKAMLRSRKNELQTTMAPDEKMFEKILASADQRTQSHHVIRSFRQSRAFVEDTCANLPPDWSVCFMSAVQEGSNTHVLVTRLRSEGQPFHIQIDGSHVSGLMEEFRCILKGHIAGLKCKDKSLWWTQQRNIDRTLGEFVANFNGKILAEHRGVMLGCVLGDARKQSERGVDVIASLVCEINGQKEQDDRNFIEIFLSAWESFSVEEKIRAATRLVKNHTSSHVIKTILSFEEQSRLLEPIAKRGHVILILDKQLQALPWESVPLMRNHSVSRMPSVDILIWQLELSKLPNRTSADLRLAAYVLNPKGDLSNTENRFADWFRSIQSWDGTISRAPTRDQCFSYLGEKDVFIYIGHGSGSLYIPRELLARRNSRACALLMGCRSGQLSEPGITEPEGMPLACLMSGSPCVLSCLWTVTDKDIDKYMVKCVTSWMEGANLTDVVRPSVKACKMQNMNGMSCVVYGLPVKCTESPDEWRLNMPQELQGL